MSSKCTKDKIYWLYICKTDTRAVQIVNQDI